MNSLPIRQAQDNLNQLVDEVSQRHSPILITGSNHEAVLISKADWDAMQESLYLGSIPGLVESIQQEATTPLEDCIELENLDW
ncbi:type II toxin-antitoxin system Phd/YefM family antitoxin [Spirulina major CS-329]|uniref:type II toxin-antitoxin system Phd/YefM family antitoxin n=1 Tax=Spirulina TaxID=1154 RepID=UPI00232C7D1B|nr:MULTISPECIES: type II toxin-antitoxin system Phd/YefM family antitoxin [Spirulina]MDB9493074.1 type II toxin-antitoxin system Phd/YefM family antitoxin [Spirulina subsalsa CS-330]MDB9503585.1 type II toxin-antitoxin system Phd/YefM family antitoxin [Spirulina major CS-329]